MPVDAKVKTSVPGHEHAIVTGIRLDGEQVLIQTQPKSKNQALPLRLAMIAAVIQSAGDNFTLNDLKRIHAIATGKPID